MNIYNEELNEYYELIMHYVYIMHLYTMSIKIKVLAGSHSVSNWAQAKTTKRNRHTDNKYIEQKPSKIVSEKHQNVVLVS